MSLYLEGLANEFCFEIQNWRRAKNCDPLGYINIKLDIPDGSRLQDAFYVFHDKIYSRCRFSLAVSTHSDDSFDALEIKDFRDRVFPFKVKLYES